MNPNVRIPPVGWGVPYRVARRLMTKIAAPKARKIIPNPKKVIAIVERI
jgi:hypothetical protein